MAIPELALAGWQAQRILVDPDADVRARLRADLDWWVARARIGLEQLG